METTGENTETKINKWRRFRAYMALAVVVAALVIFGWQWYRHYTTFITTDDAYVDADKVTVSSKILGRITRLYAEEGDTVEKGKLLVELDSSDLVAQKQQAQAARNQASAAASQSEAKYNLDQLSIKVQEVALEKAKEDLDRATLQFEGQILTKEQFDHARKAYETAQAQLIVAKAQINVSKFMIGSAQSTIKAAGAQVSTIETQLRNTRIFAPASGTIAKRWQLPGDVAQPGQPVFTITKDSALYITSYIEETRMAYLNVGKKVEFTIDAFPDITFNGKVTYIAANTASQFSLIPPNNASGNFTKVTQRIPVRVSILDWDKKDKYPTLRLVAGMSAFLKFRKD